MTEPETRAMRAARLRLAGMTLSEIGELLGVSKQRVHQLTDKELIDVGGITMSRDEGKQLAQRYEREHKPDEGLTEWLRRQWLEPKGAPE